MTLQNKVDNDKNAKEKFDQELIEYQEEVDELHSQNKDLINGKKNYAYSLCSAQIPRRFTPLKRPPELGLKLELELGLKLKLKLELDLELELE